jgi:hypothetical protein
MLTTSWLYTFSTIAHKSDKKDRRHCFHMSSHSYWKNKYRQSTCSYHMAFYFATRLIIVFISSIVVLIEKIWELKKVFSDKERSQRGNLFKEWSNDLCTNKKHTSITLMYSYTTWLIV